MSAAAFSHYAFSRALKAGDSSRFSVELKTAKNAAIAEAIECSRHPVAMIDYNELIAGGKPCVSYSQYPITLVLRALANNLRYRTRVQMPDRNDIVKGVKQAIAEATPMAIHRRDIVSFYENIPLGDLKEQLLNTALLSPRARAVLAQFFAVHCGGSDVGVPRGLPVSAVLAELAMQRFDQVLRTSDGIYRYYRFADDILIFAYDTKLDVDKLLRSKLHNYLQLNEDKSRSIRLNGADASRHPYKSFEYLGYDFHLWNGTVEKQSMRPVSVCIASSKVRKLKTRVALAGKKFLAEADKALFIARIGFVTGNYSVGRSRINVKAPKRTVRSGLFFNYRHCQEPPEGVDLPSNAKVLRELDDFLHGMLWGKRSAVSQSLSQQLSIGQKQVLKRMGFSQGFQYKLMYKFHPSLIRKIKAAWVYVR
jgi:hypothetical protein